MNNKILFVDDDSNLLEGIQRAMRKQYSIETAVGGQEGLRKLANEGPFAVVVADMQMPQMSGLEFLRQVQTQSPDAIRMMLTGNSDLKTAVDAVNDGHVFRFLTKPCAPPALAPALDAGIEQHRLMLAERELLEKTLGGAVKVLTDILSLLDPATFQRSQKLKEYVHDFTPVANGKVSWELELAAMLSQIGRVMVPRAMLERLNEGYPLSDAEKEVMQQVPDSGARLLENIPRLGEVAAIVRYQEKHFDGSGFPEDALSGEQIPIGSRILKVFNDLIEFESRNISRDEAFRRMQERVGWYDLRVLIAASNWCDVALCEITGRRSTPQPVNIEDLRIGQVLAEDVHSSDGLLTFAANTKLTLVLLVKLLNFRKLNAIGETLLMHG